MSLSLNTMCEKRDGHGRRVYIFRLGVSSPKSLYLIIIFRCPNNHIYQPMMISIEEIYKIGNIISDFYQKASGTLTFCLLRSFTPRPMFSLSLSPERLMVIAVTIITGQKQVKTQIAGVTVIADINGFSWKHIRNLGIDQIRCCIISTPSVKYCDFATTL